MLSYLKLLIMLLALISYGILQILEVSFYLFIAKSFCLFYNLSTLGADLQARGLLLYLGNDS